MRDDVTTVAQLKRHIAKFINERDWEQFHSPKNISMAIAIEAAELMEQFQWLTTDESHTARLSRTQKKAAEEELADIAMFLIDLCSILDVDLSYAIQRKLASNRKKYPVKLAKGKTHKYTYYMRKR